MPRKVLLPGTSRPNSHPHCTMPRRSTTNGHRLLRRPFRRIHCSHHSDGCILPLSIRVQRHQKRHQDCHTGPYRYHHKTLLSPHNDNHGQKFISEAMQQTTAILGIQMKHATTKHAQTIGILERTHASLKKSLKIMTGERRTMWHQFLPMAVLNYNTSYHTSLGCEPSRVFHGRVPYNVLDLKYGLKPQATAPTNHEIAEGVLQQTQEILNQSQQALMQAYVRHKRYYDRKASAHPLVVNDYCSALHPKAHSQATKLPFREFLWTGPYIVVKTLPNNNYLIRKLQTDFTHQIHTLIA